VTDAPLFLRLQTGDREEAVPVDTTGGLIRFAVGAVGERSSIWRVWANKNKSDVYIAARELARYQKYSLHESGDYRYAWTSEHQDTTPATRVIDRWQRPDPNEGGWSRGISVYVRAEDVVHIHQDRTKESDVAWLDGPPAGKALGIHIFLLTPDIGWTELKGVQPLHIIGLADRRAVLILSSVVDVDPEQNRRITHWQRTALADAPDKLRLSPAAARSNLRMAVFGYDDQGHRNIWDTALT